MSFAKVYSVTQTHLKSEIITVEADVSKGLHHFSIVGLADKTVEESKERCSLAIKYSGFRSPRQSNEKILLSLAPAHIRKVGTVFDVSISVAYLLASEQIMCDVSKTIFVGELSLDGKIKRIKGVIPMIQKAITEGFEEIIVPYNNKEESSVLSSYIRVVPVKSLKQLIKHLLGIKKVQKIDKIEYVDKQITDDQIYFDYIKGNEFAKRALLIALCGGHNICLYGPPGTGKTMLAKASSSVLPELSFKQQVELTSIYSLSEEYSFSLQKRAPFRSPHHSASYTSIVGGGREVVPGEISLSHYGVLFLDEFPEFERRVIDSLRQPLEDRKISISRVGQKVEFPCDFQLICSMNPCPCGYLNTGVRECKCSLSQIQKYSKKISGPIMDRIEIWVEVSKVEYSALSQKRSSLKREHEEMKQIVSRVRDMQNRLFNNLNARVDSNILLSNLHIKKEIKDFYNGISKQLNLSARSYINTLKVAYTISLIEAQKEIKKEHLLEALSFRPQENL